MGVNERINYTSSFPSVTLIIAPQHSIMEELWNLEDEANLLDAIADCGFGNW